VNGPVSREEFRTSRTKGREFRRQSLLDEFSISEIWARERPETGCVFAETGSNPRRDPAAAAWNVIRRKAPDHLPRNLLYRMIAYRLQAERLSDLDRDSHRYLTRNDAWTLVENVSIPVLRSHATLEDPYALGGAIVTRMGRDRSRARSSGRLAAR
jgi:hypothetical protein